MAVVVVVVGVIGWRTAEESREKAFHVRAACQISATAAA